MFRNTTKKPKNPKTLQKKLEKEKIHGGKLAWNSKLGPYVKERDGNI